MPTYPDDWRDIRNAVCARAGWKCEHCGAQFTPGDNRHPTLKNRDGSPLILTVHHLTQQTETAEDNDWTNLVVLCQRCHLHIQGRWQPGGVLPPEWGVPAWVTERGLPYRQVVQHALFEED